MGDEKVDISVGQKCILFDFDGTLVDSWGMALAIMNKNAKRLRIKPISPKDVVHLRQLGYRAALKKHNIYWWKLPFLVRIVRREMKRRAHEIKIHRGVSDLLKKLNAEGYLIGVVTLNSVAVVSEFRYRNNLPQIHIIASTPAVFGKHRVLKKILESHNLNLNQVIYIGDEPRDMIAASRIGLRCIGVLWGLSDGQLLMDAGANQVARTPSELKRIINHIFVSKGS